jgi:hypothetical protein
MNKGEQLTSSPELFDQAVGKVPLLSDIYGQLQVEEQKHEQLWGEQERLRVAYEASRRYDPYADTGCFGTAPLIYEDKELKRQRSEAMRAAFDQLGAEALVRDTAVTAILQAPGLTVAETLALYDSSMVDSDARRDRFTSSHDAITKLQESLAAASHVALLRTDGTDRFFRLGEGSGLGLHIDEDLRNVSLRIGSTDGVMVDHDADDYSVVALRGQQDSNLVSFDPSDRKSDRYIADMLGDNEASKIRIGEIPGEDLFPAKMSDARKLARAVAAQHVGLDTTPAAGLVEANRAHLTASLHNAIWLRITNQVLRDKVSNGRYRQRWSGEPVKIELSSEQPVILGDVAALLGKDKQAVRRRMDTLLEVTSQSVRDGVRGPDDYVFAQIGRLRLDDFMDEMFPAEADKTAASEMDMAGQLDNTRASDEGIR